MEFVGINVFLSYHIRQRGAKRFLPVNARILLDTGGVGAYNENNDLKEVSGMFVMKTRHGAICRSQGAR